MTSQSRASVVFGACSKADTYAAQPVWTKMGEQAPTHLVLLGDQIYMDFGLGNLYKPAKWPIGMFTEEMHKRYALQWNVPEMRAFLDLVRIPPDRIFATWDDHDFAWNNAVGGKVLPCSAKPYWVDLPHRTVAEALARQYFDVLRTRPDDYPAVPNHLPAPQGIHTRGDIAGVPLFILDTRSFRDRPDAGDSVLGAAQEQWLLDELASIPVEQPLILASGITLGAGRTFSYRPGFLESVYDKVFAEAETWNQSRGTGAFLAKALAGRKVLWLSGDIHTNAYVTHDLPGLRYPIHEAISSGLAITGYKVGWWGEQRNFGVLRIGDDRWEVELHKSKAGAVVRRTIEVGSWESS